jgi:hypothetical protein
MAAIGSIGTGELFIAQEGEVVAHQPFQEAFDLASSFRIDGERLLSSLASSSWTLAFIGSKSATTRTSPSTCSSSLLSTFSSAALAQRSISRYISDSCSTPSPWVPLGRISSSSPLLPRRTLSTVVCRVWML